MDTFTASNGGIVNVFPSGRMTITDHTIERLTENAVRTGRTAFLDAEMVPTLREFFRAERDEELGRWRYPEDHEWIVYPDGEDQLGNRHVITFWEKNGRRDSIYEDAIPGTLWGIVARAYFEAHPERKPWEDAKPGEVWALTVDGVESAFYPSKSMERIFTPVAPSTGNPGTPFDWPEITDGRRVYPEASDAD